MSLHSVDGVQHPEQVPRIISTCVSRDVRKTEPERYQGRELDAYPRTLKGEPDSKGGGDSKRVALLSAQVLGPWAKLQKTREEFNSLQEV